MKKLLTSIGVMVFGALIMSCSDTGFHSLTKNREAVLSTTPEPTAQQNTDPVVKEEGWHVPSRNETKIGDQAIETLTTEQGGHSEIRTTYFSPQHKVIYREEPVDGNTTRVQGDLELIHFQEYSLKGRVYLFELTVRKYVDRTQTNDNSQHEGIFTYRILDRDGDGKFETLVPQAAPKVRVPRWVIE